MTNYIVTKIYDSRNGVHCEFTPQDTVDSGDGKINLLFRISDFYDAHLHEGDCVTDERFEELYEKASLAAAIAKAEKMIASSDYSRQKLIIRLCHYDIEKRHAEIAADQMVERGYINEEEQTKRIARYCCLKKHWGKKRIAAELMGRGYDRRAVFAALDYVTPEEYSYALNRIISQKFKAPAEDQKEHDRRIAALSRMGFSLSEILEAFKENG